jgi:dipeptidyl aminopeptidase/acylaminoacyl peptidase
MMTTAGRTIAPYGSWKSPLDAATLAGGSVGLEQICADGEDVYWVERRPAEGGRQVIVRLGADRQEDMTPPPFNARTRIHAYGGQCYTAAGGVLVFSNLEDGRLYCRERDGALRPITPEGPYRYGDLSIAPGGGWVVCVREEYPRAGGEPIDAIVRVALPEGDTENAREGKGTGLAGNEWSGRFSGFPTRRESEANQLKPPVQPGDKSRTGDVRDADAGDAARPVMRVLVEGSDFYAAPRVSPDGGALAWLAWDHPNMPWDGTELWTAEIDAHGAVVKGRRVAGGPDESIFQPEWSPDGTLYFVSDRSGWWNLYRLRDGAVEPLHPAEAEFGVPAWVLGLRTYDFVGPRRIVCAYCRSGAWGLALLDTGSLAFEPVELPYTSLSSIRGAARPETELGNREPLAGSRQDRAEGASPEASAMGGREAGSAWLLGSSPYEPAAVVRLDLATCTAEPVFRSNADPPDPGYVSAPQAIEFATERGRTAFGFYFPPQNRDFAGLPDERPPLLVVCHGGPTDAVTPSLSLSTQFWTSRGFAVVHVNYGGSTGYGRAYRERLNGQWGIVDVEDCVNAAKHLSGLGLVDRDCMAIRGGSAGGFTALRALATTRLFRAGAVSYGVSDLEMLAQDAPKFESRYHLRLVGPYPERRDIYRARSPVDSAGQISAALILFQGLEDELVLPRQSEAMARAAQENGLPVAYLAFEGEGHGFRRAETIQRTLEAELYFYSQVFRFVPAEPIDPVQIENLPVSGGSR